MSLLINIKFPLKQPKLNTNSKKVGKIIKSNLYGDVLVLDYLGNSTNPATYKL